MFDPLIRNTARALIIRESSVLLLRKVSVDLGERFALPGGAQDVGEILEHALRRECLEEIGVEVEIEELVHVAELYKQRERVPVGYKHLVEFIYRCRVPEEYIPVNGSKPDKSQVEVLWMPLDSIDGLKLQPRGLAAMLQNLRAPGSAAVYLGLID